MEYRVLAMDMDGTALTSEKKVSPRTMEAARKALSQGKRFSLPPAAVLPRFGPIWSIFPK